MVNNLNDMMMIQTLWSPVNNLASPSNPWYNTKRLARLFDDVFMHRVMMDIPRMNSWIPWEFPIRLGMLGNQVWKDM